MSEKPYGALTFEEAKKAKHLYGIYKGGMLYGEAIRRELFLDELSKVLWFDGIEESCGGKQPIGYVFSNYFYALAYNLKCKAQKNDKQKSHKALP
jgi:hypothetical protein